MICSPPLVTVSSWDEITENGQLVGAARKAVVVPVMTLPAAATHNAGPTPPPVKTHTHAATTAPYTTATTGLMRR